VKHLLAPENRPILARIAASRALLCFDFDGTLAPIVADRDAARLRPATATVLAEVARRYPCAIVSGRGREDVGARLEGTAFAHVVGNHGSEPSPDMTSFERAVREVAPLLAARVGGLPGVDIEDKRFSLAIHYRGAPDHASTAAALREAVASLPTPMRIVDGECLVNVVPVGSPNKGDAVRRLRDEAGAEVALFVGDDVTDEDVFALDDARVVGVRVGESSTSRAPWFLRDQAEIDALLGELVALRPDPAP
jgi:trehalose 6-phosphate phosphatase